VYVKVIVCPACSVGSVGFRVMFWRLVLVIGAAGLLVPCYCLAVLFFPVVTSLRLCWCLLGALSCLCSSFLVFGLCYLVFGAVLWVVALL
jgi:hypothetical protein